MNPLPVPEQETAAVVNEGEVVAFLGEVLEVHLSPLSRRGLAGGPAGRSIVL